MKKNSLLIVILLMTAVSACHHGRGENRAKSEPPKIISSTHSEWGSVTFTAEHGPNGELNIVAEDTKDFKKKHAKK